MFKLKQTLNDPKNNIGSWKYGIDAKIETIIALRKLRTKFDRTHEEVKAKRLELENLKRELEKVKKEEEELI